MELSEERIGRIALLILQQKIERDGFEIKPKDVKRQMTNNAKDLGISVSEMAAFTKIVVVPLHEKIQRELDTLITGNK